MATEDIVIRLGTHIRKRYPRNKRAARLTKRIKQVVIRRMKLEEGATVRLHPELNEIIWKRGVTNPPRTIRVKLKYDEESRVLTILPVR